MLINDLILGSNRRKEYHQDSSLSFGVFVDGFLIWAIVLRCGHLSGPRGIDISGCDSKTNNIRNCLFLFLWTLKMADTAICVAIRSRPLLKNESQSSEILSFDGNSMVKLQNKTYTFDHVFLPGASNEEVYNAIIAQKIQPLFEGYNVTILAYGPTGSGKTYTMGTDYNPKSTSNTDIGIIPRGVKEIFRILKSQEQSTNFLIKVSYLELYREEIYDLLQKSVTPCVLREEPDGIKVMGLTEVLVKSIDDAFIALEKGSRLRHTSTTAKNLKSSRSHAIFSVYIEQTDNINSKRSKFQLVDLAGSERMTFSKTVGLQIKEGININLGLLSLGKVITHLIEEKPHIPYRDSKLTRLLQDSLGGNSHTVMIACVNPAASCSEETLSTLRYASNARCIKNRPVINIDTPSVQIEKLRKQVEVLQNALLEYQDGHSDMFDAKKSNDTKSEDSKLESMQDKYSKSVHLSIVLNRKLSEAEEKNNFLFESLEVLCDKIKNFITELKKALEIDPNLQVHLVKLEEIYDECCKLMDKEHNTQVPVDIDENQPAELQSSSSDDSGDPSKSDQTELELQRLGEITERQKNCAETLEDIDRSLSRKVDQIRNMKNLYQSFEANLNEEYINSLVNQIQALEKEKTGLQEMKKSEDKVRTETQVKIEKYEQEITSLQNELRKKKLVLNAKEENQWKINFLQGEITNLKKHRVQLVRQMKEESNKFLKKQREKEREVAKLVKEGRKKDHELTKQRNKFHLELKVLRLKMERVNSAKAKFTRAQSKTKQTGTIKPSSSVEGLEEWISEEIKIKVDKNLAKLQCELFEKETNSLKLKFNNLEELAREYSTQGTNESYETLLHVLLEKVKNTRKLYTFEDCDACPDLDGLNSMAETKVVLKSLFKKCVSAEVEIRKQAMSFDEQLEKERFTSKYNEDRIKNLLQEIALTEEDYRKQEEATTSLKCFYENQIMVLLSEIQMSNKSSLTSDSDQTLTERIEMQEKEIEKLQHIHEDYVNKCKQVSMLQQQLFQAKKGNKPTWLGNLSNNPSTTQSSTSSLEILYQHKKVKRPTWLGKSSSNPSTTRSSTSSWEDDRRISMVAEFLSDSGEESSGNDPKDPDWRLTPLEKLQKKKFQKAAKKRHIIESTLVGDSSDSSSPKKVSTFEH
ncbi:chromosome-associated kinesin KIF4 [Nephila pilipes]|uniref:Chromosome-associated kinesin KIF4 n=1 Tax=Nephila pilipes TaxID=299642 RepID=A0A8X6NHU9_NEPPI|nr:chromosome-associated kinesin KIF4 [Nephila pilipes]